MRKEILGQYFPELDHISHKNNMFLVNDRVGF